MTQLVTETIELLKTTIYSNDTKEVYNAECKIFMNLKQMSSEEQHDYRFEARKIEDRDNLYNEIINSQYDL